MTESGRGAEVRPCGGRIGLIRSNETNAPLFFLVLRQKVLQEQSQPEGVAKSES